MSRVRLAGAALFLFIPIVLVLFLRLPFGLPVSLATGVAIMLAHRFVARPFMERHLASRCFWCGCDRASFDASFLSRGETIGARACCEGHAGDVRALGRTVAASKLALAAGIVLPLAFFLINGVLTIAGRPIVSMDAARWTFKVPVAATVVSLAFVWPIGRRMSRTPAIDFPVHNLSLLGARWTLWVFRIVGMVWLVLAAVAVLE
jgi:hypothetical protein